MPSVSKLGVHLSCAQIPSSSLKRTCTVANKSCFVPMANKSRRNQ